MNRAMATIIRTGLQAPNRKAELRGVRSSAIRLTSCLCGSLLLTAPGSLLASESLEYLLAARDESPASNYLSLGASLDYTDNVAREDVSPQTDTVMGVSAVFEWNSRDWNRVDAKLEGDLAYFEYSAGRYSGDITGPELASVDVDLVRNYLEWGTTNSFRQTRITEIAVVTPDNRQIANQFSTGPRLNIPLGSRRLNMILDGKFQRASYSVSTEDSETLLGQATLQRMISDRSAFTINAAARDVSYRDSTFPGYRSKSVTAGWDAVGARTTLSLSAGHSTATQQGRTFKNPTAQIALSRQLSPKMTLDIYADQLVVGAADAIHGRSSVASESVGFNTDPFLVRRFGINYLLSGTTSFASISGTLERNLYDISTTDNRHVYSVAFDFYRNIAERWTVGAFGSISEEKYVQRNSAKNSLTSYGVAAGYRLTGRMQLGLTLYSNQQESDFQNSNFDETAARLSLSYDFGGRTGPVRLPRIAR